MSTAPAFRPHGGVRGNDLSRSSLLFGGPFGRIFRALPPADFGQTDAQSTHALDILAEKMTSIPDPEDPKDGPDNEEGGIPALFTYFGQFIDHDLTFDPASSLQKQNDPDALVDYRTPRFDLDNVYGRGPDDQPYLYEDGIKFILGKPLTGSDATNPRAHDLPRSQPLEKGKPRRAIIGDPRNDENVIVSQFQGLLHRFHNKIATDNPTWTFEQVQRTVRFHYQWVVLHDFLPKIINQKVLAGVLPDLGKPIPGIFRANLEFFHSKNEAFMPLEFSAAAYRFGHSMVRPGYRLNDNTGPFLIFERDPLKALTGFREFPSSWAIDWGRFINLEPRDPGNEKVKDDPGNKTRLQLAYKIDTSLVNPLGHLPKSVGFHPNILAERNLLRGWRMRLPTGQSIAKAMGLKPLDDDEIKIGKFTGDKSDIIGTIDSIDPAFKGNCPLWTYVLAETIETNLVVKTTKGDKKITTRQLGPVGGRIVAETFVGLLLNDSSSYTSLEPQWKPTLAIDGVFGLRELVLTALQG